jgi:hypothetical protein
MMTDVHIRLALLGLAAISCGAAEPMPPPVVPAPRASAVGAGSYRLGEVITFRGICDASGAAGLPGGVIAVADDEDNRLRLFDVVRGGPPVRVIDTRGHFAGMPGASDEMDLEGAATVGSRVYWIASHGRKKSGKRAPSRLNLFASDVTDGEGERLAFVGRPYMDLLPHMIADPRLRRYDLAAAAERAPDRPGGLNIEGLTDTSEGHLLLGFRNPVPRGRALLVRITNPGALVERGSVPRFGPPVELNLEGRGIRTVASWDGAYWMVGGSIADPTVPSRLYRWDGVRAPVWIDSIDLGDLNVEAIATVELKGVTRLLLISDDGSVKVGGKRCKKLKDPAAKTFRAVWLEPVD